MEGALQQINEVEVLDKNLAFVLRLAEADVPDEGELIRNISGIIEKTMKETNRPEFLDRIDPGAYHSKTKLLSERGRERLNKAIDMFTNKFN